MAAARLGYLLLAISLGVGMNFTLSHTLGPQVLQEVKFIPTPVAGSATTHAVTMDGTTFKPAALTIKLGDAIVWTNEDPFPHTATAIAATPAFDSKPIAPGGRFTFKPTAKGDYPYKCTLHTTMRGTLHVE